MKEDEKVSHLMKGDVYQTLLTKKPLDQYTTNDGGQYIEELKQKKDRRNKFRRLPNVVPVASLEEQTV